MLDLLVLTFPCTAYLLSAVFPLQHTACKRRHPRAWNFDKEVSMEEVVRLLREEEAQTTAEYALVILGGAAVASALIAWAAHTDAVKKFFAKVFDKLINGI